MKKYNAKPFVLAGLLVGIMLLFGISALADDSITPSIEITPKALTGTGSVRVSINIVNVSDGGSPVSVTLLDPDGNVCSGFGSGGTANLAAGSSASFSGTWNVTQKQLEAGRVTYTARYTITNEAGENVPTTRPISATITHNAAKALLNVDRFVLPGAKVVQGQTVEIRYSIKNVGTVDIMDITIKDPGISSEPAVHPLLAVGDTAELTHTYVADSTSKTTHAEISYKYELSGKTETSKPIIADPPVTIDVSVPDLIVQLTGQQIVNAGDKVDLTYVLTNKSDMSFEKLKITDKILGDIDANLSVGPNKSHQDTKSITVSQPGTYQFTVTGVDASGNDVIFQSNELTIQTTDTVEDTTQIGVIPVVLDIVIEADRDIIYQEPSIINFLIKVTNNGANPATNVVISAAGKKVKEIDRIEPSETKTFIMEFEGSMGGKYQFEATAKDNTGADTKYESNIFPIVYQSLSTPTPMPTQAPTPPPTEPPDTTATDSTTPVFQPPEEETGSGNILLYILGAVLILIVVTVGVLFFVDQRRGASRPKGGGSNRGGSNNYQGQVKVIDTIQRTPHRDYARAPKRGGATSPKRGAAVPPVEEQPSAYTPPSRQDTMRVYDDVPDMPDVPEDAAAFTYTPPAPKPATQRKIEDIEPEADAMSVYRRPEASAPVIGTDTPNIVIVPPVTVEEPAVEDAPIIVSEAGSSVKLSDDAPADMDDTAVYSANYLNKIRSVADLDNEEDEDASEPAKGKMSEEDAALLSGSTGQYRLSRRSASVRSADRMPASRQAESPEDFARKQRAARSGKPGGDDNSGKSRRR